jgi:hypothetical protein
MGQPDMTHRLPGLLSTLILAIAIQGCGKSSEMKTQESDLYDSILARHEGVMELYDSAKVISGKLVDALNAAGAGEQPALSSAKDSLAAAQSEMRSWMSSFRPPSEEAPHEEVMDALRKSSDELDRARAALAKAIEGGTVALSSSNSPEKSGRTTRTR